MEEEKKIIVTIALETVQLKISSRGEEGLGGKLTNQYHVKLGLLWNGFSDSEVQVKKTAHENHKNQWRDVSEAWSLHEAAATLGKVRSVRDGSELAGGTVSTQGLCYSY